MPGPERRWSGAFRTCAACGKRNFVGRSVCTACGAALQRPSPQATPAQAFFIGGRGSDRFQGRGMALAGVAIALVASAGGFFIYRSLRGPDWSPEAGALTSTPRPPPPAAAIEESASPAFLRPEDRARYENARRLLAKGDAKGALGPLTEAARRLPQDPAVVHDYGLALVRAGEVDLGLFQLEHASRLAPGIASYRLDLVRELVKAGRRGPAARELKALLERDPSNLVAAELLASLGDGKVTAGGVASPGVASPGAAAGSMDLGGAAGGAGSPRPVEGGSAFTNEDLKARRTAPPAPVMPSPAVVQPSPPSPVPGPSPVPPA